MSLLFLSAFDIYDIWRTYAYGILMSQMSAYVCQNAIELNVDFI